jgi:ADP-heptose:LPS heptosyltransferase
MDLSQTERIAVFRALLLGDMLCAVPALRALRHAAPRSHITLIGLPWARSFSERFAPYVDTFLEFPGFPGMPEQIAEAARVQAFVARARRTSFDLVIQLHGSGQQSNRVCSLLGAKRVAGYFAVGKKCPDRETFLPYSSRTTEVVRNLRLLEFLGAQPRGSELEFPISADDQRRLDDVLPNHILSSRRIICIHAGGKLLTRRWHAERFAAVANVLGGGGYYVVLTGTSPERELVQNLAKQLHVPHVDLCGQTDLGSLAALIQRARLVVTNDTGVSHLAAAVRTPSVIIFLGSDPTRWAPENRQLHRVVMECVPCRPCEHVFCPIGFVCAELVTVKGVVDAAHELLDSAPITNADQSPCVKRLTIRQPSAVAKSH